MLILFFKFFFQFKNINSKVSSFIRLDLRHISSSMNCIALFVFIFLTSVSFSVFLLKHCWLSGSSFIDTKSLCNALFFSTVF